MPWRLSIATRLPTVFCHSPGRARGIRRAQAQHSNSSASQSLAISRARRLTAASDVGSASHCARSQAEMPRGFTSAFRVSIQASSSGDQDLVFVTVYGPQAGLPIYIVSDVVDYTRGGNVWIGLPFELELVSDDARPPRATARFSNVRSATGQNLGQLLLALPESPRIKMEVLSSLDFVATLNMDGTRHETGTASVQYVADFLRITSVRGDAIAVELELASFDPSAEPYPAVRSTRDRLPALYL